MLTINNTLDGYLKDVEILGNTIQNEEDLADIRSVGEKVEGQELYEIPVLSVGKNLINKKTLKEVLHTYIQDEDGSKIKLNYVSMTSNRFEVPLSLIGNYTISYQCKETVGGKNPKLGFRYSDGSSSYNTAFVATSNYSTYKHFSNGKDVVGLCITYNNTGGDFWVDLDSIQLEEGTQATPYKPYQEDKLTILSPTPLEKVGDVADRLIEKDGVWGVEKNVVTKIFNGSEDWLYDSQGSISQNSYGAKVKCSDMPLYSGFNYNDIICGNLPVKNTYEMDVEGCSIGWGNYFFIKLLTSTIEDNSLISLKKWVENNNVLIKHQTTEPQFIPLPHDQQVKLRTFANKTNISFLTEIEGTIKAQVPKSLGATVNTHTEQINNLNKELDRVKKLEESTVSTVTTESDFTTVEATSNGYFEDVKLEGKTLVNLFSESNINPTNMVVNGCSFSRQLTSIKSYGYLEIPLDKLNLFKSNGKYKVIVNITKNTLVEEGGSQKAFELPSYNYGNTAIESSTNGNYSVSFNIGEVGTKECIITMKDFDNPSNPIDRSVLRFSSSFYATSGELEGQILILEYNDDLPQDVNFFEGLKSVGQGTDEIVVSSVNGNLFDEELIPNNIDIIATGTNNVCAKNFIPIKSGQKYAITNELGYHFELFFYDSEFRGVHFLSLGMSYDYLNPVFIAPSGYKYVRFRTWSNENDVSAKICVSKYNGVNSYVKSNQDKKRLLYYNNETQTWEKPVLREWDSIEKHSDGKYYYHQRSVEVVLNGSENWGNGLSATESNISFAINLANAPILTNVINDKFNIQRIISGIVIEDKESIIFGSGLSSQPGRINVTIAKSKLSTQDAQGFKQWLQTNNVTVVYQLAQEKVYECTNIDLITYANETNYIVESGAIVPRSTLKVHNNISNVVSLLQKKVSLLESNITNYMITQNRMQLASTYSADSVTFKVDYALCSEEVEYSEDLYNLILNNILVGKDNYDYDHMFNIIMDYASWSQISWDQFDILVGLMDMQHNPPIEEIPTDDEIIEEIPNEIM